MYQRIKMIIYLDPIYYFNYLFFWKIRNIYKHISKKILNCKIADYRLLWIILYINIIEYVRYNIIT